MLTLIPETISSVNNIPSCHRILPIMVALNLLSLNTLGLLLLSASTITAAPTPQENPSGTVQSVPNPTHYVAFGDSFAAGIGAGSEFGTVHLDGCHRYDRGYPSALQAFIDGHSIKDENLKACTGAKADQVQAQAEFLDETVDLVSSLFRSTLHA